MAASVELCIHVDLRRLWILFVKCHRQLATTFNHRKSHWNTRRTPTDYLIAATRSVPYMAYIAHVVTGVWCSDVSICDARVCTVLCLAGRVSFSTRVPVQSLTTANQRRTQIRILSSSSVEDPSHQKPVFSLPNGLLEPGERAHDKKFTFCRGWDLNPQPLNRQSSPLSYHRSLINVLVQIWSSLTIRTDFLMNGGPCNASCCRHRGVDALRNVYCTALF